ncbi:MAG: YbhB/YbcL family Raf kinase inhibitor-like protein [Cyclobacteriaceae bacterium]|nr:YbhB/YbcL family Raf kinase inhibitor-like protein [Cyclobacteriaceae bacterium]
MKKILTLTILSLFAFAANAQEFTLTSTDLQGQLTTKQVFSGFGCTGDNISPQLAWINAPEGTKSYAITLYDPDAPTGSGWWHWVMFNIPNSTSELKANAGNLESGLAPSGSVQSITSFGQQGFGGACPPEGDKPHAYIFTVYALDIEKIDLQPNAPPAMVGYFLNAHALAKASIISYYGR